MSSDIIRQKRIEEKERLNHKAYMDVIDCKQPQLPENETYMKFYHHWIPLQKFPENLFDEY